MLKVQQDFQIQQAEAQRKTQKDQMDNQIAQQRLQLEQQKVQIEASKAASSDMSTSQLEQKRMAMQQQQHNQKIQADLIKHLTKTSKGPGNV